MLSGPHWVESWEMRVISRLGLRPVPVGLLVTGSFMALYVTVESIFGPLLEEPFAPQVFGFGVTAVLAGYAVAAWHAIGTAQAAVLDELGPVMRVPRPEPRVLALARWWGLGGIVFAAGFMYLVDDSVRDLVTRGRFTSDGLLSVVFVPFTFFLTTRVTFFTMTFLVRLTEAAKKSLEVDLLAPERLAPLGRAGLHGSLLFVGAAALASLSVVIGGSAIQYLIIATLVVSATLAFLYPVRGASGRIRAAKQQALARIREEIRGDRERMTNDPAAAGRLPGLLAYEARIERVSEWPFDSPTLARFGLLLLLPLLSWLGGALVERALDAVL